MFKVGDKVRYIHPNGTGLLYIGEIATISEVLVSEGEYFCSVNRSNQRFYQWRFEKANTFKGNLK